MCPTCSPAKAWSRMSGRRPGRMSVGTPSCAARRAAMSLERMPPGSHTGLGSAERFDVQRGDVLNAVEEGSGFARRNACGIDGHHAVRAGEIDVEIPFHKIEKKTRKLDRCRRTSAPARPRCRFSLTMGTTPPVEQIHERVAGVEKAGAAAQIVPREQHLRAQKAPAQQRACSYSRMRQP